MVVFPPVAAVTFRTGKKVLLEGTQGTGLSLFHGRYPHVTSRDTTTAACLAEAGIGPHRVRRVVMVTRTYPIRVGNSSTGATSGPMTREIDWDVIAERSGIPEDDLRKAERGSVSDNKRASPSSIGNSSNAPRNSTAQPTSR
jgi:adenylosuccinate synthase